MGKRDRTKQWIATAYLELAETTPLRKITVQKLCDKAEINKSTFYYHFDSIQDLIHWIYRTEVNEPVRKLIASNPDFRESISSNVLSRIYTRRTFWSKVLRLPSAQEFIDFITQDVLKNWNILIQAMLSDLNISMDDLSAFQKQKLDYLIGYYGAAHQHVTVMWMMQGMNQSPEELARIIDGIAEHGFFDAFRKAISDQNDL